MPFRVRDERTGHEHTVSIVHPKHHKVLDKPATDARGRHLPAKPKTTVNQAASKKAAPSATTQEESK